MAKKCFYDSIEFGKRLRKIRKENGMTQEKLAERLLLTGESVSNIETGKTMCMPEHIFSICQIFNISADYLYFGIERKLILSKSNKIELVNNLLQSCSEFDLERIHSMIQIILQRPAT
ncbi:MAG: helix-turn-helix transcriptional regulator [Anaerostipes sp.]|nr:helix-turn-helix transcriptional regulator [Anaerostipes sp.]MDD3745108.1 helix-turn-helix transcriptional regulator [Anaerostipes sp.]